MLGAIIGDLAASTAKLRRDIFFLQLVGPKAKISECGFSILATVKYLVAKEAGSDISFADSVRDTLDSTPRYIVYFSREFNESGLDFESSRIAMLMRAAVCAWWYDSPQESLDATFSMFTEPWVDKEERYAAKFLIDIIHMLRTGYTKDNTYNRLDDVFKDCISQPHWMKGRGLLSMLFRAWDTFYQSHDFGTAINNAMRLPGDPRMNAALTGLLAEAMYGSLYYLRKNKYIENDVPGVLITIPQNIEEHFASELVAIMRRYVMSQPFFPKNNSMTNIDWHQYEGIENPFADMVISPELHRDIMRGAFAKRDNEYGIYLDNGSFYVCRDWKIYCRFRFYYRQDKTFYIGGLQRAQEFTPDEAIAAVRSILDSF